MRRVVIAASARIAFQTLLAQGVEKFGVSVAMDKERLVYDALNDSIAGRLQRGQYDKRLKVRTFHVHNTPFILVYEYDDVEVRVLFIVHQRSDRRLLEKGDVEW